MGLSDWFAKRKERRGPLLVRVARMAGRVVTDSARRLGRIVTGRR